MKVKHVWISENLYNEIKYVQTNIKKNKKVNEKKSVTFQEASEKLGSNLNKIRNSGLF